MRGKPPTASVMFNITAICDGRVEAEGYQEIKAVPGPVAVRLIEGVKLSL